MLRFVILNLYLALFTISARAASLVVTQGDTVTFNLTASSGDGVLHDLTGATFSTKIIGNGGVVQTFANAKHAAAADQTADRGEFTLTLSASDTASLGVGKDKEIVTIVTQGSNVVYFHARKILDVLPADPIQ